MKINVMNKYLSLSSLFLVSFLPWANAIELNGNVSTNLEYSNNSALVSTQTEEDISQIVGIDLTILENRKSVQANANFRVENERYYNNSFSDRSSLTAGFGLFNLDLIESFLNWQTSFTRTEVLTDSADTNTPDNREYRNILRTGPTISYQYSRASLFALNVNYVGVEISDETASDSERVDGNLNFQYLFNPITDFHINSQYEEVIDGDGDEEYANITLSVGLVRRFFLGDFQFNIGRTRLTPEQSDATESNYFDIQLNRDQFLWHDVSLIYLEDISDTSIGFESDEQGELLESSSEQSASGSDIIKRKRLDLSLNRVSGNTNYVLNGFWEKELFVSQGVEEKSLGVSLNIEHSLSRNVVSEFRYSYQEDDFSGRDDVGKDKESTYTVGARYNLSSSLSVNSFIRFSSRYNKQNMTREYEEFTTGFGLNWSFLE
jgi:hypothetical protein